MLRLIACLILVFAAPAHSSAVEQITWDDLIPELPPLEDPLADVNELVQADLFFIRQAERNIESGLTPADGRAAQMVVNARERLGKAGVDTDAMLAVIDELEAEYDRRDALVKPELNGQTVRLPGYALPLELSEEGVREFLLVPYVGACIHEPPPPPNQMILVELDQPYRINNLYDAIWLTGELLIESSSTSLSFVDGTADVISGYRIKSLLIEPYE